MLLSISMQPVFEIEYKMFTFSENSHDHCTENSCATKDGDQEKF